MDDNAIRAAADAIRDARSVMVLTGAGVSAESGMPTFRDPAEGLWAKYDPMDLATREAFARDPELVTKWYDWRRQKALAAAPNAGHVAIAGMERLVADRDGRFLLATQNVDRLHHRAGSERVVELHGTLCVWRCTKTGVEIEPKAEPFDRFPMASDAGGLLRPCVVWFGESLPREAIEAAGEMARSCDVFLTIGTSSMVYPAAGFVSVAASAGATTVEINRDATPATGVVDIAIQGQSGEVLPAIVARMG